MENFKTLASMYGGAVDKICPAPGSWLSVQNRKFGIVM